ncbi:hypothetical protein [Microbulbifer sp. PAAF003]|uniref:hypothetical protein n=1 Tax=Microbulbifer sp. PAAF003 TaxID=3243375 RepID=UPI004039997A
MITPLYDDVHGLALEIVNKSASGDKAGCQDSLNSLERLCAKYAGGELDHPLQWEALGDFSESCEDAIQAYTQGLNCSIKLDLPLYSASIALEMAERFLMLNKQDEALEFSHKARIYCVSAEDYELQESINNFLRNLTQV